MKFTKSPFIAYLAIFGLTLLVFSPGLSAGFLLLDDTTYVTANTMVWDGLSLSGIAWAFQTLYYGNWSPLTWLYHMLDCTLFGLNPLGHHLSAIVLHALNSILFLALLRKLKFSLLCSFFAAAFFSIHPLHVEPVIWISSHKDILAGFFWFISCLVYCHYTSTNSKSRLFLLYLFFSLGLMAKSLLISLPIILLLLDFWPLKRFSSKAEIKHAVLEKVPLFFVACLFVGLTIYGQKMIGAVDINLFPLGTRLGHSAYYLFSYLIRSIWPFSLSIQYPYPYNPLPLELQFYGLLFLFALLAISLIKLKKSPEIAFCFAWFLFSLAPFLQIMQVGNQAMADRWMYIPLAGVCLFLGLQFEKLFNKKPPWLKTLLPTALVIFFSYLSFKQSAYWAEPGGIFEQSVKSTKNNDRALLYLGLSYAERNIPKKAIENYALALSENPDSYEAFEKLASAFSKLNLEERLSPYLKHLHTWEESSDFLHVQRAKILKNASRFLTLETSFKEATGESLLERSRKHFLAAYENNPNNALLNEALFDNYMQLGIQDKAREYLTKAEKFGPENSQILQKIADFYFSKGEQTKGCEYVERAILVNPNLSRLRTERGKCYFNNSLVSEAKNEFVIASRIEKATKAETTEPFLLLAALSESEKQFEQAKFWYKQALEVSALDLETLNSLSRLHFNLGEHKDALSVLKLLIQSSSFKRSPLKAKVAIYENALRAAEAAGDRRAVEEFRDLVGSANPAL